MRDPLQIDTTPYEILGVEQKADKKEIQQAFLKRIQERSTKNIAQARSKLLKPIDRAMADIFMFCPEFLNQLMPKIRKPEQLTGKRNIVAEKWELLEKNRFPFVEATHSLAVLWYWWARYVAESERIEKINTLSSLDDIQGLVSIEKTKTIWENTIARWVFLINSEDFFAKFPFTLPLSAQDIQELKDQISRHFLSLFADYAYMYKKADLVEEHNIFTSYTRLWTADMDTAKLLSKAGNYLPKGYQCGRLYLNYMGIMSQTKDSILAQESKTLSAEESDRLMLQLSNYFFDIPNILEDKQYEFAKLRIEEAMRNINAGERPAKWLSNAKKFQSEERKLLKKVTEIYADICFELGKAMIGVGRFEEALPMFALSQEVTYTREREKEIGKELINYTSNQSQHNVNKALVYISKALEHFNYNTLYDQKAELLNRKARELGNEVIREYNHKVQVLKKKAQGFSNNGVRENNNDITDEDVTRQDLIDIISRYRKAVILYEQALSVARSKEAIERHKGELIKSLKNNQIPLISSFVLSLSKDINAAYKKLKSQALILGTSVSRLRNLLDRYTLDNLLRKMNIYYIKDQIEFLHMVFEIRYCTALIEKYSPGSTSDFGKLMTEAYWQNVIVNFGFFTGIIDTNRRYTVYCEFFRKGTYEKAAREFKAAFKLRSELNKRTYEYYNTMASEQLISEFSDELKLFEEKEAKNLADLRYVREAFQMYKKLVKLSTTTQKTKQVKRSNIIRIQETIVKMLNGLIEAGGDDLKILMEILELIKELSYQDLSSEQLKKIEDKCVKKYITLILDKTNLLINKYEGAITAFANGIDLNPDQELAKVYKQLETYIADIESHSNTNILTDETISLLKNYKERMAYNKALLVNTFAIRNHADICRITQKIMAEDQIENNSNHITSVIETIHRYANGLNISAEVTNVLEELVQIKQWVNAGLYCEDKRTQEAYKEALRLKKAGQTEKALSCFRNAQQKIISNHFKTYIKKMVFECELQILDTKINASKQQFKKCSEEFIQQEFTYENASKASIRILRRIEDAESYYKQLETNADEIEAQKEQLYSRKSEITKLRKTLEHSELSLHSKAFCLYWTVETYIKNAQYQYAVDAIKEYNSKTRKLPERIKKQYGLALHNILNNKTNWLKHLNNSLSLEKENYENASYAKELKKIKFFRKGFGSLLSFLMLVGIIVGIFLVLSVGWSISLGVVVLIIYGSRKGQCARKGCKIIPAKNGLCSFKYRKGKKEVTKRLLLCKTHCNAMSNCKEHLPMPNEISVCIKDIRNDMQELKNVLGQHEMVCQIDREIRLVASQYS